MGRLGLPCPGHDPSLSRRGRGRAPFTGRRDVISIPVPLLVLPWVVAIGLWLAFPWVAARAPRPDLLRWVPPGLVVLGGALLWVSATDEAATGHDTHDPTLAAAVSALCDARAALPGDPSRAAATFRDRAHDTLHVLAADPELDRGLAGDLLRAKEEVEARIADGASGDELTGPMDALVASATAALAGIGVEVDACAA
jgi:hypothetical protein